MTDRAENPPQTPEPPASRRATWTWGAGFAAVLLLALWPRLATLRLVFARGELMQWDGDSAYHLKRILYAIAHFPSLLRFDPQMDWPAGAPCPWTDGFDLVAAGFGLVAGLGSHERAATAVLLFTPVLAILAVWGAIDLARLVIPAGPAKEAAVLCAGVLTALVPATIHQSQVGFLDHHVAELLSFLLLAGWALRRLPLPGRTAVAGVGWELGGALACTFALWVFSGGILYVAMAAAIVAFALLLDDRPTFVGSGVGALAAAALALALLTLPALRVHGRLLSYQFPSLLQPLLVASASFALGLTLLSARRVRGFARRVALLAALGVAAAALGALLIPQAGHELRAGLEGWLLRRDPWIASVVEFQPFGWNAPVFTLALFTNFGAVGVAAPLLLAAGGWVVVRGAGWRGAAFVVLSIGFVLLVLHQLRFERIGQPLLMIDVAALLAALAHRRRAGSSALGVRVFPLLATGVLVATDPTLRGALTPNWSSIPAETSAALALRDLAGGRVDEGVFTSWDHGHTFNVLSGLPTPTNGFGSYLDPASYALSQRVLEGGGSAFTDYLSQRRLRYVAAGAKCGSLLDAMGRVPFEARSLRAPATLDLELMKKFPLSALVIGGSAIPGAGLKHLETLMPVFGTVEDVPGLAFPLPVLWLYERVPGARITGNAPAGARVVAALPFREQGRPHVWKAYADAATDGTFEMTVPLPTRLLRPAFASDRRFSLTVNDGPPVEVEVPESAVRAGSTIRVGRIAGAPPADQRGATTAGSRSVKTAPPPSRLPAATLPPKDSAIP